MGWFEAVSKEREPSSSQESTRLQGCMSPEVAPPNLHQDTMEDFTHLDWKSKPDPAEWQNVKKVKLDMNSSPCEKFLPLI